MHLKHTHMQWRNESVTIAVSDINLILCLYLHADPEAHHNLVLSQSYRKLYLYYCVYL